MVKYCGKNLYGTTDWYYCNIDRPEDRVEANWPGFDVSYCGEWLGGNISRVCRNCMLRLGYLW